MRSILLILCCFVWLHFSAIAQSPEHPNALAGRLLFIDYQYLNTKQITNREYITNGFEFSYIRNLNKTLNFAIPFKAGVARFVNDINNTSFLSVDGLIHLRLTRKNGVVQPYILGGVGVAFENFKKINFQAPVGLGVNIRVFNGFFLTSQIEGRFSANNNRSNHQIGVGFLYNLGYPMTKQEKTMMGDGSIDTDGDGVTDDKDACPTIAGIIAALGCPDTDGDGIANKDDACEQVAGLAQFKGCPDTDKDGITDADDKCPNEFGSAANMGCPDTDSDSDGVPNDKDDCPNMAGTANGCPDADGDGVADKLDDCPTEKGTAATRGCPDSDSDGLANRDDKCPNQAGPRDNNGCPEITKEDKQTLDIAMRAIQFETGKATLKQESYATLEKVIAILEKYSDYRVSIEGHTDNVGNDATNQALSVARAKACYDYLILRSIPAARMAYTGFGKSQPLADNGTEDGRYMNRRVEFKLLQQ